MKAKVLSILAAIAPTIATATGGPLAGAAVAELARRFTGGKTEQVEDFILGASPEQLAEIKSADQEFKIRLQELGLRLDEINASDRADARSMAKTTSLKPQVILSAAFLFGYFLVVGAFMGGFIAVPDEFRDTFSVLLGVLTANIPGIMQFWFGSSSGSKTKDLPRNA